MPYAAGIQRRESAREEEVKSEEGPPLDGFVAQDLLGAIQLNQSSIPALARDLRVPHDVVKLLVERMVVAGRVTIRQSKRSVYVRRIPVNQPPLEGGPLPTEGSRR